MTKYQTELRRTQDALTKAGGARREAARALGISIRTLENRVDGMRRNGMKVPDAPKPTVQRPIREKQLRDAEARAVEAEARIEALTKIEDSAPMRIAPPCKPGRRHAVAVVVCSDFHVEEPVYADTVNGRNEFNLDICKQRFAKLMQGVAWQVNHHSRGWTIDELVMAGIGDFVSNTIHDDLLESNLLSPSNAILFWHDMWLGGVDYLLANTSLKRIRMPLVDGNHGRLTHKMRVQTRTDNSLETLVYRMIAKRFEGNPRVDVKVATGAHLYMDVWDQKVRLTHGDAVNYGGGVGGITIPIRKAISAWDRFIRADLTLMGHWHSFHDIGNAVVNGSLIGYSPYSLRIKADFEPPQQAFFLLDRERGKVQVTPIWVQDADKIKRAA